MLPLSVKKRYAVALCCNCGGPRVIRKLRSFFLSFRCGYRNSVSKVKFVGVTDDIDEAIYMVKRIRLVGRSAQSPERPRRPLQWLSCVLKVLALSLISEGV